MPYDITFEAESKTELLKALRAMIGSYTEGLKKYKKAAHLAEVPLSDPEDIQKWHAISQEVFSKLLNNTPKIESRDYYAEAQLPA